MSGLMITTTQPQYYTTVTFSEKLGRCFNCCCRSVKKLKEAKEDSQLVETKIHTITQEISCNSDNPEKLDAIMNETEDIIDRLARVAIDSTTVEKNVSYGLCGITVNKTFAGCMIIITVIGINCSLVISIINKAVNDPNSNCIADWASWTKMALEIILTLSAGFQVIATIVKECINVQVDANEILGNNATVVREANKLLKLSRKLLNLIRAQASEKTKVLEDCVSTVKRLSPEVKASLAPQNFIPTLAMKHLPPESPVVQTINKINDLSKQISGQKTHTPNEQPKGTSGEESVNSPDESLDKKLPLVDKATLLTELGGAFKTINAEFWKLGWKDVPFTEILCGDHIVTQQGTRTKLQKTSAPPEMLISVM